MKQKKHYQFINIVVLLLSIVFFIFINWKRGIDWKRNSIVEMSILILTAVIVHSIKIVRLYFVLYGRKISLIEHIKQYCKVISVSMILPFKLGEFFRVYCYGYQIQNYFDGIMIILVDRFVDTLGLLTMILFINIENDLHFSFIFYLLLFFLIAIIICYLIFPGIYHYWKHELLISKVSRRKNDLLYLLEKLNHAYLEVSVLIKGRCAILYVLSFCAWGVEIGGIFLCNQITTQTDSAYFLSEYLTSVLLGTEIPYLRQFILVSILLLLVFYFFVHIFWKFIVKKGEKNVEHICDI